MKVVVALLREMVTTREDRVDREARGAHEGVGGVGARRLVGVSARRLVGVSARRLVDAPMSEPPMETDAPSPVGLVGSEFTS